MANTTTGQIPAEVNNFYDRTLLYRAIPLFVHTRWAQVRDIPRKAGTLTIKFRRYSNLTAATTALSEGITPTGSALSVTDITATVAQYGDFVTVTDVLDFQSQDPVLMEAAEILGDQMGDTLDQLTRDVLNAGTNVYYGGTGHTLRSQVASGEIITDVLIKKAVRLLKGNKTRRLTKMVNATTGYGTSPLNASYVAICHPNTTYDLKAITGWTSVEKYASTNGIMEGEVGKYDEVRFVETTNAKVFSGAGASSIDVYSTLVFGSDAYGTTRISGEAVKNIIKPLGSAGSADPLEQRATSGWKATFVAKVLNDAFIMRIEHAVSA
jgi:N4-gp56 family major capsid protein